MTITDESVEVEATEAETEEANEEAAENGEEDKTPRGRDFTVVRDYHQKLADFINERSGIDPVTPHQVKATLALRTDYGNTDEAKAAREERKRLAEAEKAKYAGMNPEQIKAAKASKRAEEQAERLQKKAQEALARAATLSAQASGSGEDLAAIVAAQEESVPEETEKPKRRGLGNRNRAGD
jgi:hypothetical protein